MHRFIQSKKKWFYFFFHTEVKLRTARWLWMYKKVYWKLYFTSKLPVQHWTKSTYLWMFPKNLFWMAISYFRKKQEVDFRQLYILIFTTIQVEQIPKKIRKKYLSDYELLAKNHFWWPYWIFTTKPEAEFQRLFYQYSAMWKLKKAI